ncbi:MAG: hypothetical protein ACFFCW_26010 [Candidatus Hodarchaeota archaeon]
MYHSEFHLERIREVPDDEVYWHELEDLETQRMNRFKDTREYDKELKLLRQEYLDKLYSLIGEKILPRYLKLHERRIKNMRAMKKKVPKTIEGLQKLKAKRQHNLEESEKLIKRSGVDVNRIEALRKEFQEKVIALFLEKIGRTEEVPGQAPARLRRGRQYVYLKPPYQDRVVEVYHNSTQGSKSYDHTIEYGQETGRIKHDSHIHISESGDDEYAYVNSLVKFDKILQVPQDCNSLNVIACFEAAQSYHKYWAWRECYFSSWLIIHSVFAEINVKRVLPIGSTKKKVSKIDGVSQPTFILNSVFGTLESDEFNIWEKGEPVQTESIKFDGPYKHGEFLGVWGGIEVHNVVDVSDAIVISDVRHEHKMYRIFVNFE